MALEFRLKSIDEKTELDINAQNHKGDKGIIIIQLTDGEQIDYDFIGLKDLYGLAMLINHEIGFNCFDLIAIREKFAEENKINDEKI